MNKLTLFFSAAVLSAAMLLTGCAGSSLSKADEAKSRMQYKIAADLYTILGPKVKGPTAKEDQAKAREEAAYCYRMANEYEKALKAYEKVLKKDPRWQYTKNAREEVSSKALRVLRDFGFQG